MNGLSQRCKEEVALGFFAITGMSQHHVIALANTDLVL